MRANQLSNYLDGFLSKRQIRKQQKKSSYSILSQVLSSRDYINYQGGNPVASGFALQRKLKA